MRKFRRAMKRRRERAITIERKAARKFWKEEKAMQVKKIARSKTNITGVKVYGTIQGDSGKEYRFAYIRLSGFRGWICSCESFILRLFGLHRNCKHLRHVRNQFGRYGTKVDVQIATA